MDDEGVGGKGDNERRGGGRFQFGLGLFQLCSRIRSFSGSGELARECDEMEELVERAELGRRACVSEDVL